MKGDQKWKMIDQGKGYPLRKKPIVENDSSKAKQQLKNKALAENGTSRTKEQHLKKVVP